MGTHRLLGETVDTLCFILILTGSLFLFSYYWCDTYQLEYAEYLTENFFEDAERMQVISAEGYTDLVGKMSAVNAEFEVTLQIKRGKQVFYQRDVREYFLVKEQFPLLTGDFIMVTISKGQRKRTVLSTVIWW